MKSAFDPLCLLVVAVARPFHEEAPNSHLSKLTSFQTSTNEYTQSVSQKNVAASCVAANGFSSGSLKDIQGRNRFKPMSGVPAKLISTLSVGPIAEATSPMPTLRTIRARIPKLQPPPPRLPADQATAPDLLKLYREAASKASAILLFSYAFQHVLSPVITVTYEHFAV